MPLEIINKVEQSGILSIDLEDFYPKQEPVAFDIKEFLFMEMILKEKEFRQKLKELDWSPYAGKQVAIFCSNDAIIPRWAYMLIAVYIQPIAADIFMGSAENWTEMKILENIAAISIEAFDAKKVVIKGCGDKNISAAAYLAITKRLLPVVQSIMYGEPCSTVPVYKRKP